MPHFPYRKGRPTVPFVHTLQRRADPSCNNGGFYNSPSLNQSIPYNTSVNISWKQACLNSTTYVDIHLYAPGVGTSRIHAWHNVYSPPGSYQTQFQPKWWNSTQSANLQLLIVPAGTAPFLAPYPPGPIFTVTYQQPSSGSPPAAADVSKPDDAVTVVNNNPNSHKHLTGGRVAAAVFFPLLVVVFVLATYVKLKRGRGKEERKRWSEAVDQRMSTISTNWKPISAAGANAAIRSSIATDSNSRVSAFSFGNIRPNSTVTVTVDGGQAGVGSRARTVQPGQSNGVAQLRSSATSSQTLAERVSRVSFAPDVRPSSESRRTVISRAYHTAIVPPLPDRKWESTTPNSEQDETISPTQTSGPETLSIEDIQARLAGQETTSRPSVDAVMPALRLMRTGDASSEVEDEGEPELLFSAQSATSPTFPSPTHNPQSPDSMSTFMPMQPMPANMMSPDEMLRAYAERRAAGNAGIMNGPTVPSPTYAGVGAHSGMRTLYSPTHSQTQTDRSDKRTTVGSQYSRQSDDEAYGGSAL